MGFSAVYGIEAVALRYFNVFGPRQDPDSQYSGVIPKFLTRAAEGEPLVIFGDGTQSRDFTFDNVVAALVRAAGASPGSLMNVRGGHRCLWRRWPCSARSWAPRRRSTAGRSRPATCATPGPTSRSPRPSWPTSRGPTSRTVPGLVQVLEPVHWPGQRVLVVLLDHQPVQPGVLQPDAVLSRAWAWRQYLRQPPVLIVTLPGLAGPR